jgi:sulfate adenylyltransferase subunit 1
MGRMMDSLRFITAGNVDDGKSTLIGRLLYDSDSIHTDQLGILKSQSKDLVNEIDLALITDGLRAEREQGITIDVAYKYFSTNNRKFIIADAPGHEQYTRNMITGASNSDVIIVLIDARHGITTQTKRHSSLASIMGIKTAIIAINKMDLVGYSQEQYETIKSDYESLLSELSFKDVHYIPLSAYNGDNVVIPSTNMPWYNEKPLLPLLESIKVDSEVQRAFRFQVQYVVRPKDENLHDYRGYAGKIASGSISVGDTINVGQYGTTTRIKAIEKYQQTLTHAEAGDNVILHIEDDIDLSRGDTFLKVNNEEIVPTNQFKSWLAWLDDQPLQMHKTYLIQHKHKQARVKISDILQKWDVNNWQFSATQEVHKNDVVQVNLRTNEGLYIESFSTNYENGAAILIDETSFNTVGALMIL